jgi:type II secretory pathway component PulF
MLKLRYDQLAMFADNLATCLTAGVELKYAIRTSSGALVKAAPEFRGVWGRIDQGQPLSEALRPVAHRLPSFVLPVVVCGEQTGRLDESLRFLAEHCRLLHRPSEALRNVWLFPLAIHFGGLILACILHLLLGSWSGMLAAASQLVISAGTVSAIAILIIATPIKLLVDRIKLWLPVLGSAEREISVNRFLHVFSLLYGGGGQRVEKMVRDSCQTVSNVWLREKLLRAATQIERGGTLPEAFARTTVFTTDEHAELEAGELAGRLAETSARIAVRVGESAAAKLTAVTHVITRITMFMVTFSLVGTVLSLAVARIFG